MLEVFLSFLVQVIKGWDQGIVGGEGIPPMLAGASALNPAATYLLAFAESNILLNSVTFADTFLQGVSGR